MNKDFNAETMCCGSLFNDDAEMMEDLPKFFVKKKRKKRERSPQGIYFHAEPALVIALDIIHRKYGISKKDLLNEAIRMLILAFHFTDLKK